MERYVAIDLFAIKHHGLSLYEWHILSIIESKQKLQSYVYIQKELIGHELGCSISSIYSMLNSLKDREIIEIISMSDNEAVSLLSKEKYSEDCCEWCGTHSIVYHKHHYPIRKKDGGCKLVTICPNCHYAFHFLTDNRSIVKIIDKEIINAIANAKREAIK